MSTELRTNRAMKPEGKLLMECVHCQGSGQTKSSKGTIRKCYHCRGTGKVSKRQYATK